MTRYVGKADNPKRRYSSHLREPYRDIYKHLPSSIWIKSLQEVNVTPSMEVIDEISYLYDCEWCDKETYSIADYLFKGHPLENTSPGSLHPFCHDYMTERKEMCYQVDSKYNNFKLKETEMYYQSNMLGFEEAWKMRKKFWAHQDDVSSKFQLEIAKLDFLKAMLIVFAPNECSICGISMNRKRWAHHKEKLDEVLDIFEEYSFPAVSRSKGLKLRMRDYTYSAIDDSDYDEMLNSSVRLKWYNNDYLPIT